MTGKKPYTHAHMHAHSHVRVHTHTHTHIYTRITSDVFIAEYMVTYSSGLVDGSLS